MELRVLRYFQAVVADLNISRAAERLHVSQPTISRQLKDLETELGVTLFDRHGRHLQLTDSGEYFAHQVTQILALTDKTLSNIHTTQAVRGTVVIGCAESRNFLNVAQTIRTLQRQHPQIQVSLVSTNADEIRAHLKTGTFDFGVVMDPTDKSEFDFLKLPGESRWGLLVPRFSALATRDHLTLADLENQNLILSQQRGIREQLRDWYGESTPKFNVVATYNLLYNASLLVSAGVGYALCIDGIINTNQSDLVFIPLTPRLTTGTSLVWHKDQHFSPAAATFLKQLAADNQQTLTS
ncbi:LysR family transcriptional regulator [Levilactobacillus zymae]|uniref:LysR family transcriptional regulator n=1 Tax=Levilactobacillus zymae TaxID=267363 RepID=UPI003FCE526B